MAGAHGAHNRPTPAPLSAYVPELALDWHARGLGNGVVTLAGTLVFADISGFTRLTERLARRGRFGAEEMSDHLDAVLSALLERAYGYGAWLAKWGGDALLLMFEGGDHAARAAAASVAMRSTLAVGGALHTSVGPVRLRMSVGIHSGDFDFLLAGGVHRELLIFGAAATVTAILEATADAGEILISPTTAAALPPGCRGTAKGDGVLLARVPPAPHPGHAARPSADAHDLVPELVAAHLAAAGGAGEHRPVAVAFVEWSGVDALARRSEDHGAVAAAVRHVVDSTEQACRRYRVSFHETDIAPDGGKIMLVAGAPHALDDPAEAMLCTVRDVLDAGGPLRLRAGVTTGRVFAGSVGPDFRRSYSVKGDVVNLAARILGKAPHGAIWALPAAVDASRTKFAVTAVAPFTVKGKTASVEVVEVGAPIARVEGADEVGLVGREVEWARLADALNRAREGTGSCVTIIGAAGMGKTRLMSEARRAAAGTRVLSAAGEPFRSGLPYAVIRTLLLDALGLRESSSEALATDVTAWCRAHAPDMLGWLPLLGPVLQVELTETEQTADLAPEWRVHRLHELVAELLAAALDGPTLVCVDDMHMVDTASREALSFAADGIAERPWAIVTASRPTVEPLCLGADTDPLVLTPLIDDASLALLHAETDDAPLAPHISDTVVARAAGNPFLVRRLARAAAEVADAHTLPDSVEAMVAAQIDRLRPASRDMLRAAAVIGMTADIGMLRRLLDGERSAGEVSIAVNELHEFVEVEGSVLRFRQAITRDTAYEGLPYRRRVAMHARMAALLAADDDGRPANAAVLSLHRHRAGDHRAAWELALVAAEAAAAGHANFEAAQLYRRALESAQHLSDVDGAQRAEVLEQLGDVEVMLGNFDESDRRYNAARRLRHAQPARCARIGLKMARSAGQRGDYAMTLRRLDRVRRTVAGVAGAEATMLRGEMRMRAAYTHFRQGRLAAARTACVQILARDAEVAPGILAEALCLLDIVETSLGVPVDGSRSQRALALYDFVDGLTAQARLLNQIGYVAYFGGRWDDAVAAYRQAGDLLRRSGDLANAAVTEANVAEVLLDQGKLADAEVALQHALRIWRAARADNDAAFAMALLGRVLAKQGRTDDGERLLQDARERFTAQAATTEIVDVDAYLAECLQLAGRYGQAFALAQATLTAAGQLSALPAKGPLLWRVSAVALDGLGRPAEADAAFEKSLAMARALRAGHEFTFTLAAMAERTVAGRTVDLGLVREALPLQRRAGVDVDLAAYERSLSAPTVSAPGADPGVR